jgi:hypothetical protein
MADDVSVWRRIFEVKDCFAFVPCGSEFKPVVWPFPRNLDEPESESTETACLPDALECASESTADNSPRALLEFESELSEATMRTLSTSPFLFRSTKLPRPLRLFPESTETGLSDLVELSLDNSSDSRSESEDDIRKGTRAGRARRRSDNSSPSALWAFGLSREKRAGGEDCATLARLTGYLSILTSIPESCSLSAVVTTRRALALGLDRAISRN